MAYGEQGAYMRVALDGSAPATDPSPYPIGVIFDMPSHMLDGFALENTKECDRAISLGYSCEFEKGELYLWLHPEPNARGWYRAFDPVEEEFLLVNPALLEGK